ncbi:hypothetical protein TTHERM_000155299 (macronuclear) [Tetrahymena thermophila SB210]|uniref:Uncharacterized protein n=1 Tax=Tetrahymena thermophila (strain SB210) TaxID=312017 RepID=W7XJV9_TETTS|nr:hypothetical protein TTHERM_000155299 [Tetrahymena thermophila SB210]EWS75991.1 hypothetical protein TTHERM_000155299 [Tetrahymena thermophila SB210]|eukprot:XP_012651509.1 hypothetical protein TTHERM_000155299 [Tetrahymena thermophila SB210]
MSTKKHQNGDLDKLNISFTLTDDSENIAINQSDQNDIIYNIDCISDQSLPQQKFQQFINEQENIFEKHNISSIHEQPSTQESKTHHQTQITFGKDLPTCQELNQQKVIVNNGLNKSSFKNYKQYVVSLDKLQEEQQKINIKKQPDYEINSNNNLTQTTNQKNNKQNYNGATNNLMMNNNSQSNLKSSTTHDETQSTNMMTCMLEKTQTETLEFLKKQLIILQSENEKMNVQLNEKEHTIQEMKKSTSGLRDGITIRDYEQTISKQAIELIQLRQNNEQLQKENKQLQQEIVKNKAEGFQKYEDLKKNNEELLEAYEEKFQCQLDLVNENCQKQIASLESKIKQDQQLILDLKISNENQFNRIQQLEKENQKLQVEKDSFLELSNKYKELTAFFDAQNKQQEAKSSYQNSQLQNMQQNDIQNKLNINEQNEINSHFLNHQSAVKLYKSTSNQNQQVNNQSQLTNQNKTANNSIQNNNSLSFNDLQKVLQKQALSQEQNVKFKEQINQQIQNLQNNQSKILSPRGTDQSPQQSRDRQQIATQNKSAYKQQKYQLDNQVKQEDQKSQITKNSFSIQGNTSNSKSQIIRSTNKSTDNNQIKTEQENSFISNSQKQQQKQFQLELGQAQEAQKQQLYSYSTQTTKRNHYLQQNISHRHYPSQLNSNQNLSHNKSCEDYNSPLSHRESSNSKSKMGSKCNQSTINNNNSQSKYIVRNYSKKELNSSGNCMDANLFQHEMIKEYLSPQINQTQNNYRDSNYKAINKYLQQKKKKGINSQEQHSFYNTINTNSSSNSLLIASTNKTQIQDQNSNNLIQSKINQTSKTNLIQNQIQAQISSSFVNERVQLNNDEQKNISHNQKNTQQKMAKSFSIQQLINQQHLSHYQNNINKQKQGGASLSQQVGKIPLPQNIHSQSVQNTEGQETYSPRINTSRSTNANRNNLTAQKIQEKQMSHQQSSHLATESPQLKREDRSTSNSILKSPNQENDFQQKQPMNSTCMQNNHGQQPNSYQNKHLIQINRANVYSRIKNQIQQQQQQYSEQNNYEITDI